MKKLLLVSLCFLMLCITQVFAQNRTVTGTVTAKEDGLPIPGVTVKVQGTNVGTQTNTAGKYTLSVPQGATLVFSFIGYETLKAVVTGATHDAQLVLSSKQLGEVVVTGALGIKRASKENGYNAVTISNTQLNESNETNVLTGLAGKVAGLQVNTLDNSISPQFRFVLRGNRSINGNNQALIVVDGLPIPSGELANLNPEDFESSTVLEGASAAALYGSEGSNGAIIFTTKRGTSNKPVITYTNSLQAQVVTYIPWTQYEFGLYGGEGSPYVDPLTGFSRTVPFENQNYGPQFNGQTYQLGPPTYAGGPTLTEVYSPVKGDQRLAFFQTGITEQNQVTYSQGDGSNGVYFSAQNVFTQGVVPRDQSIRDAVAVNGDKTYGIFKIDFKVNYSKRSINTYSTDYGGGNLYTDIMQWPANIPIRQFENSSSLYANPSNFYDAYAVNPWWIIDNSRQNIHEDVLSTNLNMILTPTKWLDINYKLADNFGIYQNQTTIAEADFTPYSISDPLGAGNIPSNYPSGSRPGQVYNYMQYGDGSFSGTSPSQGNNGYARVQQDFDINLHHTFFNDLKANLLMGTTIWQQQFNNQYTASGTLLIPNYYNINTISGVPTAQTTSATIHQLGAYGDLHLGYKDFVFLDATGRNDWDSRLPVKNRSIFFPSVSGSFILTDAVPALKNNNILNYAKLRVAVSQVGQVSIPPYSISNIYSVGSGFPYGSTGGLNLGTTNYSANLKPETVNEVEYGGDFQLFNGRIDLSLSHYDQHSKNQTIAVNVGAETGFTSEVINAGELESWGEEFSLKGDVLTQAQNKVGWNLGGNFQINDSKVLSLAQGQSQFNIAGGAGTAAGGEYAVVGQPYPIIRGTDFVRDPQGQVVVSAATGYPTQNPNFVNLGRTTPKYILGLNTTVSYKFISLYVLAEYRSGYVIYNAIGNTLNFAGISGLSASAGREDFVFPNSVIQTGPNTYQQNTNISVANGNYGFWQSSAYNTTTSPLVSSAAFWRLSEVALNFKLDRFIKNVKFIKGLTFGLNGRNLMLFKPKNAWTDPEFSNDNSNATGYATSNQIPGSRLYGGNIKVTF